MPPTQKPAQKLAQKLAQKSPVTSTKMPVVNIEKLRNDVLAIRKGATSAEMSERIRDVCNQHGYDPIYELIDMVKNGHRIKMPDGEYRYVPIEAKDAIAIHKDLLKYIYPGQKTVDQERTGDTTFNLTVKNYGNDALTPAMKKAINADFSIVAEEVDKKLQEIGRTKDG